MWPYSGSPAPLLTSSRNVGSLLGRLGLNFLIWEMGSFRGPLRRVPDERGREKMYLTAVLGTRPANRARSVRAGSCLFPDKMHSEKGQRWHPHGPRSSASQRCPCPCPSGIGHLLNLL